MTDKLGMPSWFSANARVVCFVDRRPKYTMDCLHVFRSLDWQEAFRRALDLGRSHEKKYENADGEAVEWRFKEVVTLDILPEELDGAEVHSLMLPISTEEGRRMLAPFAPEQSDPSQTI
jgi:hypothetical protein